MGFIPDMPFQGRVVYYLSEWLYCKESYAINSCERPIGPQNGRYGTTFETHVGQFEYFLEEAHTLVSCQTQFNEVNNQLCCTPVIKQQYAQHKFGPTTLL